MTKRFIKVNTGAGFIQFPGGYPATDGQVAILDDLDPRLQEQFDYAATQKSFENVALPALISAGKVKDYGTLTESVSGGRHHVQVALNTIANGEVYKFRPGFAGNVLGFNAFCLTDATTASKAATLGYSIVGSGHADIVVGASANPATLDLTTAAVTDGGTLAGETIVAADRARNVFNATDWIVVTASSVTAFTEGAVVISTILSKT